MRRQPRFMPRSTDSGTSPTLAHRNVTTISAQDTRTDTTYSGGDAVGAARRPRAQNASAPGPCGDSTGRAGVRTRDSSSVPTLDRLDGGRQLSRGLVRGATVGARVPDRYAARRLEVLEHAVECGVE